MASEPQQTSSQTQTQSQTPSYMPEMGRGGSSQYSDAHYRFLNTLIESESARTFFKQIAETDFSHQCVNAFFKILTSGFDKNAILAANVNIEARKIDFDIALNLMVLECHESDVQNPAFLTFRENIRQTFIDFISRSKNAEERKRLLRSEYGTTVTEEQGKPGGQQQQGGFSKFGRGP
jgi:hypothetical protein